MNGSEESFDPMTILYTAGIVAGWYAGVVFFGWTILSAVRSGEAGESGVSLSRTKSPLRFWIRVTWRTLMLIFMTLLPILIYWKQQT